MKKITPLLLITLLYASFSFSQEFTGFGSVKIGMSEEEFLKKMKDELDGKTIAVTKKNLSQCKVDWSFYLVDKERKINLYQLTMPYEILDWPLNLLWSDVEILSNNSKDAKFYYLPVYKMSGIKITGIFVVFIGNKIQAIASDFNNDILKAASEKYEPVDKTDTSYKIKCTYVTSGVTDAQPVIKRIYRWEFQSSTAFMMSSLDYDDHCKPIPISTMRFWTTEFTATVRDIRYKIKDRENEEDRIQAKDVKDKI